MELTYVTIVVLASMIFVLAGMVGYLYWQQTNMLQHLQSLAMALAAVAEQIREPEPEPVHVTKEGEDTEEEEEDDRVSVKDQVELVEGPPRPQTPTATSAAEDDSDDIHNKTAAELRDLLTKKGIPFGKRDSKAVLLQLLMATG
jgi:anionic cell wall polymer biosynthesis LytR-Cps2A-Psr (LCP) family protein